MITYAESRGREAFDWNLALERRKISEHEWEEMEELASKWTTCACGNQCSIIPRGINGGPEDEHLSLLGQRFLSLILIRSKRKALACLNEIELRSAELIAEINARKNFHKDFKHENLKEK